MKISDLIIETFKDCIIGTIFSRQEIIKNVSEKFDINESSIIPSDYCYNRWNKGVSETKRLCLFEYIDTTDEKKYRYLGQDCSYNGKVYHKAKGDMEKCVGEYVDGVFTKYEVGDDFMNDTYIRDAWLLTWNPKRWEWSDFKDAVEKTKNNEIYAENWSCSNTHVKIGDRVFLTMLGTDDNGIIASGYAYRESFEDLHWNESLANEGKSIRRIGVRFDTIIDFERDDFIKQKQLIEMFPEQKWNPQGSGIKIKEEYVSKLENIWNSIIKKDGKMLEKKFQYHKNQILYGPPGTGKTYNSVNYAVAIIESKDIDEVRKEDRQEVLKRYNKYKKDGLINFCTFHQSFGYEEFIEGIKPETTEDNNVIYKYTDGIFKEFCEKKSVERSIGFNDKPTVWKIVLQKTTDNTIKKECLENNHIRIGYVDDKSYDEIVNENDNSYVKDFVENIAIGDLVVVHCYPNSYDAIGVVTSEFRKDESFTEFKQIRDVKWLLKDGIIRNVDTICEKFDTRATIARISTANLNEILNLIKEFGVLSKEDNDIEPNKVFIIDEINRGNISKIFGELITLIEDSKRIGADEELIISLPYSKKPFGVPNNVYLLGTMNTADRSIALIDTALRRRFKFVEMRPNAELVDVEVAGIKIKEMLEMINRRIEVLYDREHTIGHSFFMGLSNNSTIEDLAEVFECNVIPLLKEYFYDDYERIAAVLGDNLNQDDIYKNFISRQNNNYAKIFNSEITLMPAYKFNTDALKNPEAYKKIYL